MSENTKAFLQSLGLGVAIAAPSDASAFVRSMQRLICSPTGLVSSTSVPEGPATEESSISSAFLVSSGVGCIGLGFVHVSLSIHLWTAAISWDGADIFAFTKRGKKEKDILTDFDSSEGDMIGISAKALKGISSINFATADSKAEMKTLFKQEANVVYLSTKGKLYYDQNGEDNGLGKRRRNVCQAERKSDACRR